jgi:signal transduction histidine kinase
MRPRRVRLAAPSWLRLPRRTARLRLTALYGGLFLLFGAALLAITYLLVRAGDKPSAVELRGNVFRVIPESAINKLEQLTAAFAVSQTRENLSHLLVKSGVALVIMAVFAVVLGWIVAGRALRPVSVISAATRRISATSLHQRLDLDAADGEFRELSETLDGLFARLEATFEAQRHFVANASHELRTPLTRERILLQVALADPTTPEIWRSAGEELLASNREQETIIEALLALASSESGVERYRSIDLSVVAHAVLRHKRSKVDRLRIQVDTRIATAPLEGDPSLIERLADNLLENAIRHNVPGGRVHLSTGTRDGQAVFSITNTGPVIPPSEIDRLFQPFQRLDRRRAAHNNGHGLGLSIVRAIATAHDALVTADAPPTGGLTIDVTFPSETRTP